MHPQKISSAYFIYFIYLFTSKTVKNCVWRAMGRSEFCARFHNSVVSILNHILVEFWIQKREFFFEFCWQNIRSYMIKYIFKGKLAINSCPEPSCSSWKNNTFCHNNMENNNFNNFPTEIQKTCTNNEVTFMSRSKTRDHLSICSKDQGNWTKNLIEMGAINPETVVQYLLQVL